MTSAEIIAEFVKGRPSVESELRRKMTDGYVAPEAYSALAKDIVVDALSEVTDDERKKLDRMRGNGGVDWTDVAKLFGAREDCGGAK